MEKMMMIKPKRKELEEVNDDFSDFSLSSPARKIRRLDLPPIIEEEEMDSMMGYEQQIPESTGSDGMWHHLKPPVIEELPYVPENEEKAIVLFKPVNTPHSYSIDPNLISSFKTVGDGLLVKLETEVLTSMCSHTDQALWGTNLNTSTTSEKDESLADGGEGEVNACRAVIPWVPSQHLNPSDEVDASQTEVSESMEAEEPEATTMEIEDTSDVGHQASDGSNLSRLNEGLHHQWQQHCMIPQPPQNSATPIVWYR